MITSTLPLAIRLLGPPQIFVHGTPLPRVRTHSVEWLLALLALREGAVSRSWMAGTLWPDSSELQALLNLRTDLVRLRKALGVEARRIVSSQNFDLSLDGTDAEIDVREFDAAIRAGDEASLRRAVELYRGPLLSDCNREWVAFERDRRAQECLTALLTLAEVALAAGDDARALDMARRAQALDPSSDRSQRAIMEALDKLGDAPAALMSYRDYRIRLLGEMGVEPDAETSRLFQEIRQRTRAQTRAGAVAPSARRPMPEPVLTPFQVPHELTPLVGRDVDTQTVRQLLGQFRLVTLVGGGGVGKTRLAMAVASMGGEAAFNGAVWVELAPLSDVEQATSAILAALGADSGETDAIDLPHAQPAFRIPDPAPLLVLDNCEHLLKPVSSTVLALLQRSERLRILATSRQRLGVAGERVWKVPSLQAPPPEEVSLEDSEAVAMSLRYPAVRLFVDRASEVCNEFRLQGREDALAVSRICNRLDGIPLALELAAARTQVLPISEINSRLDDRFRLLAGVNRAGIPRHQTLRALIDWSHDALDDPEKRLLRRLSVFVGGWDLSAASAVCEQDPEDVLTVMAALVDKSLVSCDAGGGRARYSIETVQHYAALQLRDAGEEDICRRLHLDHYLQLAERVEQRSLEPGHERELAGLEQNMPNLRAALKYAALSARSDEHLRLAIALTFLWGSRGWFGDGMAHLRQALDQTKGVRSHARAKALVAAFALCVGQYHPGHDQAADAEGYERELKEILLGVGDTGLHAEFIRLCCIAAEEREDYVEAARLAEESRDLFRECGDAKRAALAILHWCRAVRGYGDHARAEELCRECLAISRSLPFDQGIAESLHTLSQIVFKRRDLQAAKEYLAESLVVQRKLGFRPAIAYALESLARLEISDEHWRAAQDHATEAAVIWRDIGNAAHLAATLLICANAALHLHAPNEAETLFQQALSAFEKITAQADISGISRQIEDFRRIQAEA